MNKILKKQRGESIIESLIAIMIIMTSLVGIMVLFSGNIKANQSTKNRIIAINLAREGIEAVRFIRDSNWLIYSNNRRVCWNFNPTTSHLVCNSETNGMNDSPLNGNYNAILDPNNFKWSLKSDSDGIDLDDNQLYLKDGFYQHDSTGSAVFTPFMRQIQISYLDAGTTQETNNRIKVVSLVQWDNNQKIELEAILTDFLERQDVGKNPRP